jgi:hypothetical protein
MIDTKQDDGSLLFLKIEPDKNNRHFNCPETTQQKLINLSFWVCDYLEDVKTKFGNNLTEAYYKQSICPWWGWAKYCDSINLINKLLNNSKYDIKFRRNAA